MATLYSQRVLAAQFPSELQTYVVPDGYRLVVRDIGLYWNGDESAGSLRVGINGVASFAYFTGAASTPAGPHWQGRQVLEAGEELVVEPLAGNWGISISGYLLTAP